MQFAKHADRDLRPEFKRAGAAGMKPGRRLARNAEIALVDAEACERRHRIGLGSERIRSRGFAGPVAARAHKRRMAEAHACSDNELILWEGTTIGLADLEQRAVGKAAIAVALCRGDKPGQEPRPHLGEPRRDW